MQKNKARNFSLPQFNHHQLTNPIKRKDPGKTTIPDTFKSKLPPKNIKTNVNPNIKKVLAPKPPEKLIKPKIIWKNLNKFNIKQKFVEILSFLKVVMKKIGTFLKESQNIVSFIIEKKGDYNILYEKLNFLYSEQKRKSSENQIILKNLQQKKDALKNGNQELLLKIQNLKLQNKEISKKIERKVEEHQILHSKNNEINEKYSEVSHKSSFLSQIILK